MLLAHLPSRSMPFEQWREQAARHAAQVDAWTTGRRDRARRGEKHPVEDFLLITASPAGIYRHQDCGTGRTFDGAQTVDFCPNRLISR